MVKKAQNKKTNFKVGKKQKNDNVFEFLNNNLLFLSMYVFTFLVLINIFIDLENTGRNSETLVIKPAVQEVLAAETAHSISIPRLKPLYNLTIPFLSAQGAVAIDLDSGSELFEKDPNLVLFPASTVKIVTALVALDYYRSDMIVTVGPISVEGQKMGLFLGERIKAYDLIKALLVYSANDAAEVLADAYPGGRDRFIEMMNSKANEIGLSNTFFVNPTGLDGDGQVTTPNDLIKISKYAMSNREFAQFVNEKFIEVKSIDGVTIHNLENTNKLLGRVDGVRGVKTGWTEFARENLVTYIERDGRRVLIVLLGSQDRFGETEELISWIFENYEWVEVRQ